MLFEYTLLWTEIKVVVPEAVEDVMSDLAVFFQGHGEDEDVVQVNCDFSCGDEVGEDGVHESLEGGG